MEQLIECWDRVCRALLLTGQFIPSPASTCYHLRTRRGESDQSCPDGTITVQQLIEGFAKYREIAFVAAMFSLECALEWVVPTVDGVYAGPSLYIMHHLGGPPWHPLSGALQEVALLCFLDPFLTPGLETVFWEDIHPGMRFQRAVEHLTHLDPLPDAHEDAYQEVLTAYGITDPVHRQRMDGWLADALPGCASIDALALDKTKPWAGFEEICRAYTSTSFVHACDLRRRHPSLFFEPLRAAGSQTELAVLTRPPFLIGPAAVSIPHGAGRPIAVGLASIFAALSAVAREDIARDADLSRFVELSRKAAAHRPPLINGEAACSMLDILFGPCLSPFLPKLMEKYK